MHSIYLIHPSVNYDNLILENLLCKDEFDYSVNVILSFTQRRCKHLEYLLLNKFVKDNKTVIPPEIIQIYNYLSYHAKFKLISEFEAKYLLLQVLHQITDIASHSKMPEIVDEIIELYRLLQLYNPNKDILQILIYVYEKLKEAIEERYFSDVMLKRFQFVEDVIKYFVDVLKDKELVILPDLNECMEEIPVIENLIIDFVTVVNPMDCEIIRRLINKAKESTIYYIKLDESTYFKQLIKYLESDNIEIKEIENRSDGVNRKVFIAIEAKDDEISSILPTKENEIRFISHRIKEAIIKGLISIDEVDIIFPEPYKYISTIRRLFESYKIDYNYSFGERILNEPAIQAAYSILKLIAEDFPRDILLFILRNKYFYVDGSEEIINEVKQSSVIYGIDFWKGQGKKVAEFVGKVKDAFDCKHLDEYLKRYENLLKGLNFGLVAGLSERDLSIVENFWGLISSLKCLSFPIEIEFNEFKRMIGYLFSQKRYFGEEKILKGANVMGIIEASGMRPKVTFFAGLIDGDEPKVKEYLIFPDSVMELIGLPTVEAQIAEQRYYYNLIMNSSADIIYLTYPQFERDQKTLCSFFLTDYIARNSYEIVREDNEGIYSLEEHLINKGESEKIKLIDYIRKPNLSKESVDKICKYYDNNTISVTDLMKYYECPQQFYFFKILQLEEIEEPTFDYNAKEWGTIVHRILCEAFEDKAEWKERAFNEFKKLSKNYPEGVREFFYKRLEIDLDFLENFQREIEEEYIILDRELILEREINIPEVGKQRIKGVIDRIDRKRDTAGYLLIDYKIGSADDKKYSMQLPLYAWLYEQRSGIIPDKLVLLALNGLRSKKKELIRGRKNVKELVEKNLLEAKEIIKRIREGLFYNLEEDDEEIKERDEWKCKYCNFKSLCWG